MVFVGQSVQDGIEFGIFIRTDKNAFEIAMLEDGPGLNHDVVEAAVFENTTIAHICGCSFHVDVEAGLKGR